MMTEAEPEPESPAGNAAASSIPRRGKVIVQCGQLVAIRCRWLALPGSSAQVWLDTYLKSLAEDHCCLYYTASRGIPGYMTLDYVRSGPKTSLKTFRGAMLVLDELARLRRSVAIFAHVGTTAISDRLLLRWGWQQHAEKLTGRHWVKRFYDGHPRPSLVHLGPVADALGRRPAV